MKAVAYGLLIFAVIGLFCFMQKWPISNDTISICWCIICGTGAITHAILSNNKKSS